jgi:hypothetical protein
MLILRRQQHGHSLVIDRRESALGVVVMKENTSSVTADGASFLIGPWCVLQMPAKANKGRGSSPLRANQFQVAGFTSPLGSQKDDAGTRHRRRRTLSRQKEDCTLSSRVLVTLRGAFPGCGSTKPHERALARRHPLS